MSGLPYNHPLPPASSSSRNNQLNAHSRPRPAQGAQLPQQMLPAHTQIRAYPYSMYGGYHNPASYLPNHNQAHPNYPPRFGPQCLSPAQRCAQSNSTPTMRGYGAGGLDSKLSMASFLTPLKVIVGEEGIVFLIQKGIIVNKSDFFKAACNEHWESGQSNEIVLKEDNPKIFGIFLSWLLTGSIDNSSDLVSVKVPVTNENADNLGEDEFYMGTATSRYDQLLDCYFYAGFLQCNGFQNHVMDAISGLCRDTYFHQDCCLVGLTADHIIRVFRNTQSSSPLRKFVLDCFLKFVKIEEWLSGHAKYNHELHDPHLGFYEELALLSVTSARKNLDPLGGPVAPWLKGSAAYHV